MMGMRAALAAADHPIGARRLADEREEIVPPCPVYLVVEYVG
jgi:hypothetical protein